MNAQELSQLMLDFAGKVHGNCMDRCLEKGEEYEIHNSIRELLIAECCSLALHARRQHAYINRFNTHTMPLRVRVLRDREARKEQS